MKYGATWVDTKPNFIYVFAAARGIERQVLIQRTEYLLRGAVAWYGKDAGRVILHPAGGGFEVAIVSTRSRADDTDRKLGEHLFGRLKICNLACGLAPQSDQPGVIFPELFIS